MADGAHQEKPISLFYSYSHRDEELRKKLEDHLAALRWSGMIAEWHDRNIEVGDEWAKEIDRNLSSADIILLLVSSSFIASEYCWSIEMKKALERHDKGEAKVIPVILRPCFWRITPFAKLQAAPTDAKPVTSWSDQDEALYDVAGKIERAVTDLQQQRRRAAEEAEERQRRQQEETEAKRVTRREPSRDFIKEIGEFLGFGGAKEVKADDLKANVEKLKLPVEGLDVKVDGDKVTVFGKTPSQEIKEKVVLALGNVPGIAKVEDHMDTPPGESAAFYTVQSGDTLSAIAKKQYGDVNKYNVIFEANKPMLSHPDKIFPGMVLRVPKLDPAGPHGADVGPAILRIQVGHVANPLSDLAVFRDIDQPWCPEMVVLPVGQFLMGSPEDEKERYSNEGPQHRVTIGRRYAIGRFPVTFDEYDHFCAAAGRKEPKDNGWGRSRRPVINVSWRDAAAYCAWLANETGQPYRLPSEAEWEYAARAGTTSRYAFGDAITPKDASYWESKLGKTTEVGAYSPNAWGLYDMHGNVWEWVEDVWHDNYQGAPVDGSAWTMETLASHVIRGGSRDYSPRTLRSAGRDRRGPDFRDDDLGFRVARTLD